MFSSTRPHYQIAASRLVWRWSPSHAFHITRQLPNLFAAEFPMALLVVFTDQLKCHLGHAYQDNTAF
jgi:hypothetical protein